MIELRCKKCGSVLTNQEEIYICCACGARYEKESASSYTEELVRILDKQKQEAVANLRMQLWREFNEKDYDLEEIRRLAKGIKSYLPNDFFANFCDFASERNSRSLSKFLLKTDVVKYKDYVWDMLNFLMRPLRGKNLLAVNELLARIKDANLDMDKFSYYNDLLIKKYKEIDEGVYDVTLPRDVFVAYSSADMEKVEELVETLEEQNISCFVAARNLQHGAIQHYEEQLEKAMDSCKTVVFVSSSNSRNRNCDALMVELAYIKKKDIDAAPGIYRHDYEKMPKEYKKPRVEYLISKHKNTAGDRLVEEFFAGYEYCYNVETVAKRILDFIATPAMGNIKYCVACGTENAKKVKYCSECAGQEFVPTKEEYEEGQRIQERASREVEAVRKAEEEKEKVEAEAAKLRAELERLKAEIGKTMTNADGDGVGVQAKKIEDKPVAQTETTYAKPSVAPYPKASPASDFIIKNGELRKCVGKGGGVVIPDGVTSIGDSAFKGCSSLTSITIPDSVTSIEEWAFGGCSSLASITVFKGNKTYHSAGNCLIKTESKTLIAGCKNSVIPADGSVTSIGWSAFRGCSSLTSITIPDSVTSIGYSAFRDCSSLISITIPNSVTSIGERAFYGCSSLTSIKIPNSVTEIGHDAFIGCSGLTSITVFKGNKTYHSKRNCLIETESKTLIAGCKNSVIPADGSVTSIGEAAFFGCSGLTSITIPNSVTEIRDLAFIGCSSLTSITVDKGNKKYHSAGNCLIEKKSKTIIAGCKNSVIPADGSVTRIGMFAFYGCSSLTSITIPDSVTSIWGGAFNGCSSLTSITIPDSVTSIEDWAFEGCSGLTSITIPNSVTSIGKDVFCGCPAKIYCHRKKPLIWPVGWDKSLKGRIIWDT